MPLPPRPGAPPGSDRDLRTPDLGEAVRANEELTRQIADAEERLEALRARYDLYFLGVERREPARDRDEIKREVNRLKTAFTHNTGLKFRIQTLHARFLSYERMWQRTAREKEEGTYRRDVQRARRAAKTPAAGAPAAKPAPAAVTPAPPAAAAAPPAPAKPESRHPAYAAPAAAAAPPAAPAPSGLGERELRALHAAYVDAKRRCNEDVSKITVEALARSVAKQLPELTKRFNGRAPEFKVEVKDGRAVLKAVPRG